MVVTKIDEVGLPTDKRHILRLRKLAGLIARQRLSLVMPKFNSLTKVDKWRLFDQYVTPFLEFPAQMKTAGFKQVMKRTAKSWRTHKSNLVCNYIAKGLEPIEQHPYIEPEDWAEFVQFKQSEAAQEESAKGKVLREKNMHNHHMGSSGYEGKLAKWEEEDRKLEALGIPNPWDEYPNGRPRYWLRARSTLEISEGTARIRWNQESTKRVAEQIIEK